MGAVVWDLPFGNFRLGLCVWERSSGVCAFWNFRLRAVARKMLLPIVNLTALIWKVLLQDLPPSECSAWQHGNGNLF